MNTTHEQVKAWDQQYHVPTYGRFDAVLVSGKGAVAVDANGKEYIDFGAGIGVNALGYCDEGWARAVSEQAGRLQHCSNLYYNDAQAALVRDLCEATGFARAFLCNSGAEANECAVKIARKYSFDRYGAGRDRIVTLKNSFHGRTVTTLAATGQDSFHQYFYPFTEGFVYAEAGNLQDVADKAGDNACAVLLEPIQGEGGVVPLDSEFVRAVAELCRQKDMLLLFDEVQTGVGRIGTLYAWEQFGVRPDVVTSAKGLAGGLPFGACLCAQKAEQVLGAGMHGSTFGGNPIASAAASYVLSQVNTPAFLEDVRHKGEWLRGELAAMPGVRSVRGLGLMLGLELDGVTAREVAAQCIEQGLLILTAKELLRLLPPLNITMDELQRGTAVLRKVLSECTGA